MKEAPVLLWPGLDAQQGSLRLEGQALHHLCRVLRLRTGDALELRDGRGLCARGELTAVARTSAQVELSDFARRQPPAQPCVHLALPLLKGRRLDWALEKGTELGVTAFHLYQGRHGVVQRETRPERYDDILAAAFAQSRRLILPSLDGPVDFAALLARGQAEGWRQCWADERCAGSGQAAFAPEPGRPLLAWVGPEGGFATEERQALAAAAEFVLDLGPQRLRAETAALAVACRLLLPVTGESQGPR